MLFVLLASYGRRKIDFLKPPLVKFYNMRGFFFYITEFRFFGLILLVGLSLGNFSTNCLNMQPGLTSFSPIVSIPPFCVHNEFKYMTGFLAYRPKAFLFEITTWIDCFLAPWLDLQEFDLGIRLSWFFFYFMFCFAI